eukprot:m.311932 g.311932  ORF g.311932 m.311932 type:complete len:426 (+) comp16393_c0_seq1:338-1615(+)
MAATAPGEGALTIDALPQELLAAVLHWVDSPTLLGAVPRVCRRWRDVRRLMTDVHLHISVSTPLFKTSTQLPTNGALMSFLVQISQHFGSVTHLSFSGQLDIPSPWSNAEAGRVSLAEVMTTIAERFPALISIHLGGVFRYNHGDLCAMLERLPQLVAISEFCEGRAEDDVVAEVVKRCPKLQHIDMSANMDGFRGGAVQSLTTCKHLVSVNLSGQSSIDDAAMKCLASSGLPLKAVLCSGCDRITDEGVVAVAEAFTLTRVSFKETSITDVGVRRLAETQPALKSVAVGALLTWDQRDGTALTAAALIALVDHCPNLTSVGFTHVRDFKLDQAVTHLARRLKGLVRVDLGGSAITDVSLDALATHAAALVEVGLDQCEYITDSGVAALAASASVRDVSVSWCDSLTTAAAEAFARRMARTGPLN